MIKHFTNELHYNLRKYFIMQSTRYIHGKQHVPVFESLSAVLYFDANLYLLQPFSLHLMAHFCF